MPAVTIVAAWISAETGVGPSIASGSQTWSGNWALLPQAPRKKRRAMPVRTPVPTVPTLLKTSWKLIVPKVKKVHMIARPKPRSPMRLTMNAFLAASAAAEPEADQQVGAEPDAFPEDKQQQKVVGQHQHQHRKDEEGQVGEKAPIPRIAVHVADGIDVDEKADRRDDDEHQRRQLVGVEADRRLEIAGRNPGVEPLRDRRASRVNLLKDGEGEQPGDEHRRGGDPVGLVADEGSAEKEVDRERQQRQE